MKRRKKILLICVAAIAVVAVLITVNHYRVKWKVERYKAELRATGEALEWTELLGKPTPPELNGALLFKQLTSLLPQSGALATNTVRNMIMIKRGKAMAGWAQPWVGELSLEYSNSWNEAFADYESQKGLLNEFHEIRSTPVLDFNLDYSQGPNLLLPHLAKMKTWTQRLSSASACELRLGHPDAAMDHLLAMLILAKGNKSEPLLITHLVHIAIASIAGGATWDLLQAEGLNDADLAQVQEAWAAIDTLHDTEYSLRGERCFSLHTIAEMRESSQAFHYAVGGTGRPLTPGSGRPVPNSLILYGLDLVKQGFEETTAGIAESAWRTSWSYTDELNMLKGQEALLELIQLAIKDHNWGNALKLQHSMEASGLIPETSDSMLFLGLDDIAALRTLFTDSLATYSKVLLKTRVAQANARMTMTAVALKRYRLRHDVYPESLESLIPEFIASVPTDTIDGAPLRYRRLPDENYLLYSIGEDLVDDGGDVRPPESKSNSNALHWLHGRDWVWPQPANREQIRAYWEKEISREFDKPTPSYGELPSAARSEEMSVEEKSEMIDALAEKWTEEYLQTLTNTSSTP